MVEVESDCGSLNMGDKRWHSEDVVAVALVVVVVAAAVLVMVVVGGLVGV